MQNEHPIDRLLRIFRVPLMILALLSTPVFLFTYAWGMRLLVDEVGLGWWLLICLFHVIAWIGVASLFDARQSQVTILPPER